MKKLALAGAAVAALALAGCDQSDKLDAALAKNLPAVCKVAAQTHMAFVTVAATGKVKADVVNKEGAAWAALSVICNDPASVKSDTAIITAANAYAAWVKAVAAN